MTATIKKIEITEAADLDATHFKPDDPEDFVCTFGLTIGPTGSDGGELFYITVCTPKRLEKLCERDGFIWGRHHLIVPHFDLQRILSIFTRFVSVCSGQTWNEIGSKLARLGSWEFEDYDRSSAP
jgi:hypothetical protein